MQTCPEPAKGPVNNGEGATKREGGGASKVLPLQGKKGVGRFSHAQVGAQEVWK